MLLAWGRLARLSLFPSALADAAAGMVLATGGWPAGSDPWVLLAASALVYHGGMLLNDWADREQDRAAGRERPLVDGSVSAPAVLIVALSMIVAAPLLVWAIGSVAFPLYVVLAALVLVYDLGGRGPLLGPLLLAACRALNVLAGLTHGSGIAQPLELRSDWLLWVGLYALYVFVVSRLGRLEDREDQAVGGAPRAYLLIAAAALALAPWAYLLLAGSSPQPIQLAGAALALVAAFPLAKRALSVTSWTPKTILPSMGMALRRLLVFSACAALMAGSPAAAVVAALLLLGYPASHSLRGAFPPS